METIIFLDIDGVLNGYNLVSTKIYKLLSKVNGNLANHWKKEFAPFSIHKRKVKVLKKIVNKLDNPKIIIVSSWGYTLLEKLETNILHVSPSLIRLRYLLDEYKFDVDKIEVLSIPSVSRNELVKEFLDDYNIKSFVIIDDEASLYDDDLQDHIVITSKVPKERIITGSVYDDAGLKHHHIKKAIKIAHKEYKKESGD